MSFGGKKYDRLHEEEVKQPFLRSEDSISNFSDSDGSGGSSRKLSKRQKTVLLSFIVITAAVVVTVSVVLTQKKDLFGADTRISRSDRKFTLDEVLSGKYSYESYSTQWVSDQSYLHRSDGNSLSQYNMDTMDSKEIFSAQEMAESRVGRVKSISPDKKWFLFSNNSKQLYRHSFFADYYVKNFETGKVKPVKTPDGGSEEKIRYSGWSSKGHALVFVYKCNIYYVDNVADESMTYFQITNNGVPKKIFNGVPDWVYEEEIIASTHAIEFSPDGKLMAYVTFNATDVPFYKFPRYGAASNLYTTIEKIAYPKAGYPNPTIKLNVIDISLAIDRKNTTRVKLEPPAEMTKGEYYYSIMRWSSDNKVFVQWLNRAQNDTYCSLYDPDNPIGTVLETHQTPNGWIDDDYVKPYFSKDGSYYITMLPKNVPGKGDFRHLAKVSTSPSATNRVEYLTEGDFTVQDINCYNEDDEVVYFRSTESSPRYRQVYSIDVKTKAKKCVSCGIIKDSDGTNCTYYYPQFSKQCSWVTLMCQGPFVPITSMYGLKSEKILTLTSNKDTKELLAERDLPVNIYYTVKSDDGLYDIPVKETRPVNFNKNKKYAVLFDVYGGPNTQKVTDKFGNGFEIDNYFVGRDIIVISCDARGTGFYGYRYLYSVYRNLGYYESLDALAVAKYLQKQSYVDPERIAIWGWSYGGFYAATTLAMSNNIIKTAVAVAPVTDWRYYDTVYSERYMGLPTKEDNLKGYEATAVMARAKDFAGKNFLLIHGTADDNVHFQNSAQLVSALIKEKIKFRSQFYTDRDHSISSDGHIYYLIADYLLAHLKGEHTPGKYYGIDHASLGDW